MHCSRRHNHEYYLRMQLRETSVPLRARTFLLPSSYTTVFLRALQDIFMLPCRVAGRADPEAMEGVWNTVSSALSWYPASRSGHSSGGSCTAQNL